jgi:hypothetical protein
LKLLLLLNPGVRHVSLPDPGWQLDAHWLYPEAIRVSGLYGSDDWSKLLIIVEEGRDYSAGACEIKGEGMLTLVGAGVSAFN